jgi:DNA-binding MarR family transcriptional regulator
VKNNTGYPRDSWADLGLDGERLSVPNFPAFHIIRLAALTKNHLTRPYLDQFGLSLPEWRLLSLLATHAAMPFSEVTTKTFMDKGQVSRTLRSVHKKGYVAIESGAGERKVAASGVSPRVIISISPEGKALFERILPIARKQQMRLINLMSLEERTVFLDVVQRLQQFMIGLGDAP